MTSDKLKEIIKNNNLDETLFSEVFDDIIKDKEQMETTLKENADLKKINSDFETQEKKYKSDLEEQEKKYKEKEKELIDLKVKYIDTFNKDTNKINNTEDKSDIQINDLFTKNI